MNVPVIAFYCIFVAVFGLLSGFVGIHMLAVVASLVPAVSLPLYWAGFFLFAFSFLAGKLASRRFPSVCSDWLAIGGAYSLGFVYYAFWLFLLLELLRLLNAFFSAVPAHWLADETAGGFIIGLIIAILVFGAVNAGRIVVRRYDIRIGKRAGNVKTLRAVLISDVHLGAIVGEKKLQAMVKAVRELEPDIVLLAGDIIDEDVRYFARKKMVDRLKEMKPRLGSFLVYGNHEYRGGEIEEATPLFTAAGMTVLQDEWVKVADAFYVVGRQDVMAGLETGRRRQGLSQLMQGVDVSLPVLLLDHQPRRLAEAAAAGVDLQVSGHTHRGQIFPASFMVRWFFEKAWGYWRKDQFQLIVSAGYGTWGPPLRIGTRSELVDIHLVFAGD